LLLRDLYAPGAFMAVEEVRELLGLVGADPDHDPGFFTQWPHER
jgi:hypothetical protein